MSSRSNNYTLYMKKFPSKATSQHGATVARSEFNFAYFTTFTTATLHSISRHLLCQCYFVGFQRSCFLLTAIWMDFDLFFLIKIPLLTPFIDIICVLKLAVNFKQQLYFFNWKGKGVYTIQPNLLYIIFYGNDIIERNAVN